MKSIMLTVQASKIEIKNVLVADTFLTKAQGLIGKAQLSSNEGMLIKQCCSIHTFGMTYAIDVIFLNSNGQIIRVVENLKPLRFARCGKACMVLELRAGSINKLHTKPGDILYGY